jgi:hypothetical protein
VGSRHVGDVLSLVAQGLRLGVEFGTHSVEALLWVAETVEEGVYEAKSLRWTAEGLEFALDNPPLRVGAFTSLVIRWDGSVVPADRIQWRSGPGTEWRPAESISAAAPLRLAPGDRTEFRLFGERGPRDREITVRLELHTPAIPPRVWFEFTERAEEAPPGT